MVSAADGRRATSYIGSVSARYKPHRNVITLAIVLCICVAVRAQSSPDTPPQVSSTVVAIGVVALDPGGGAVASFSERPASINGSGFWVSKEGHVITALHVIRAAERVREQMQGTDNRLVVGLRAGSGFVAVAAEVVGSDEAHDLALLRATAPGPIRDVVRLSSTRPQVGALIEAAGLPGLAGSALVFNTGHLADTVLLEPGNFIAKVPAVIDAHQGELREFYLADLKSDEGMSGGPVYLVGSGAVIGVVEGYTHNPRLAVLIPAQHVIELLKSNNVAYQLAASAGE